MFREKKKINTKEEDGPYFVPHLPESLTRYCWPMLRAEKIPWLSRPTQSMEAGSLRPRKGCKQHPWPAWGSSGGRAASLRCKRKDHSCSEAEGKYQRWPVKEGTRWDLEGTGTDSLLQPLGKDLRLLQCEERSEIFWYRGYQRGGCCFLKLLNF